MYCLTTTKKLTMSETSFSLEEYNIHPRTIIRNASPSVLYEEALTYEADATISSAGALIVSSYEKTGRSPKDKRIVEYPDIMEDVWWGDINMGMDEETFMIARGRAVDYLNTCERVYVVDGFAGWDPKYRLKIRIVATLPYHALFMHNMLIRPSKEELADYGDPDYVIFNAGRFPANPLTKHMTSRTSVELSFDRKEFVILGTEYAGEMKKGVFTIMNYIMPKQGVLSMHSSANVGKSGDVAIFFGLSGTGKTTLSADPKRQLIGDDEHCWTDDGIFNIEGGCYAKCINLSEEKEPDIFKAIRFGTVLENVDYDEETHIVDYDGTSHTENTRASYPIDFILNAKIPCVGGHPQNIIFLTCDAFGVLPPVSKLSSSQAMYHFISGYTAKVAGTEMGVTEPEATFSACFGAAFMVWHPSKYAKLLAERIEKNGTSVWLVNTGWSGGGYGEGERMSLKYTRSIIDAILDGSLKNTPSVNNELFGFEVPTECPNVPDEIMQPRRTWSDANAYDQAALKLANMFKENFKQFEEGSSQEIIQAGPNVS
jgi:phosphoenolpyruvate carboxykinase (ATP)